VILTALNISLCILAVYACTREGMILERPRAAVQTFLDRVCGYSLSEWLQKPLFGCLVCMASLWTLVLSPVFSVKLWDIPIMALTVCGINYVLWKFIGLCKNIERENTVHE